MTLLGEYVASYVQTLLANDTDLAVEMRLLRREDILHTQTRKLLPTKDGERMFSFVQQVHMAELHAYALGPVELAYRHAEMCLRKFAKAQP